MHVQYKNQHYFTLVLHNLLWQVEYQLFNSQRMTTEELLHMTIFDRLINANDEYEYPTF
jgi:hypothetical protein